MTSKTIASQALAKVADDYRRRGYDVDVAPTDPSLPSFLEGFRPDLIARSPNDSVVVEVKVDTYTSVADHLREVVERVNRQPGWRFSLVFVDSDGPDQNSDPQPAPLSLSQERVRNAEAILQMGQPEAASLLLFSALEGILRVLGYRAQLPIESLPPSALIRELYSAGEIDRGQYETLMRFLPARNRLVHGLRSQDSLDVEKLRSLVQALLADAQSEEAQDPA